MSRAHPRFENAGLERLCSLRLTVRFAHHGDAVIIYFPPTCSSLFVSVPNCFSKFQFNFAFVKILDIKSYNFVYFFSGSELLAVTATIRNCH